MSGEHITIEDKIDQIIQEATKDSMYSRLGDALQAGAEFLIKNPSLRLAFKTNAQGGIEANAGHNVSAQNFIQHMDEACDGFSVSSFNVTMGTIEKIAIEAGRPVSKFRKYGDYNMVISPPV